MTQRVLARQYDFWGNLTDKECCKCSAILPIWLFSLATANGDGHASCCTPCKVEYNRATGKVTDRTWHLKTKYAMTQDEWTALFEKQGRCCAACGAIEAGSSFGWHTDHDHATERVRGILCRSCNAALGCIKDSPERAEMLAAYLRR